jgi:hypothetical protein
MFARQKPHDYIFVLRRSVRLSSLWAQNGGLPSRTGDGMSDENEETGVLLEVELIDREGKKRTLKLTSGSGVLLLLVAVFLISILFSTCAR